MWVRAASFSGILFCCLCVSGISRAQVNPTNTTYSVRGVVVNSVTGEPIPRVLVQIPGRQQHSALTGADGKFEFADIPAGMVDVTFQKPGYFPAQQSRVPTVLIRVSPNEPAVVLKLAPEAVIFGRVLGDGGEPAEQLPVQIFGEQVQNGRKTWTSIRSAQTDYLGEFRLAELQPGRYYVFAGPSPWPASFGPRARLQPRARMRVQAGSPPAARGYPGVFYPAAEDRGSATPLQLKAGQHVEVNFNVASQVFHTISGTVSGYAMGNQGLALELTNAAGTQVGTGTNFDQERGTFRTQWLPPGRYTLSAETRDIEGHASFASLDVNLTSDVAGVHLQLLPGATIPVTFQVEKTRPDSGDIGLTVLTRQGPRGMTRREGYEPARVTLTSLEPAARNGQRQFSSQLGEGEGSGSEIAGVPPGTYWAQFYANGPYYVRSARCGSMNLMEQNLTIAAGASAPPIELELRDDYGHLHGSVRLTKDMESAMILAIPEGGERIQDAQVMRTGVAFSPGASEGTFALQLAPGTYKVLALDRGEEFEYGDPEALRKYSDKAPEVTIAANEQGKVELDVVHVEE